MKNIVFLKNKYGENVKFQVYSHFDRKKLGMFEIVLKDMYFKEFILTINPNRSTINNNRYSNLLSFMF